VTALDAQSAMETRAPPDNAIMPNLFSVVRPDPLTGADIRHLDNTVFEPGNFPDAVRISLHEAARLADENRTDDETSVLPAGSVEGVTACQRPERFPFAFKNWEDRKCRG